MESSLDEDSQIKPPDYKARLAEIREANLKGAVLAKEKALQRSTEEIEKLQLTVNMLKDRLDEFAKDKEDLYLTLYRIRKVQNSRLFRFAIAISKLSVTIRRLFKRNEATH